MHLLLDEILRHLIVKNQVYVPWVSDKCKETHANRIKFNVFILDPLSNWEIRVTNYDKIESNTKELNFNQKSYFLCKILHQNPFVTWHFAHWIIHKAGPNPINVKMVHYHEYISIVFYNSNVLRFNRMEDISKA